MFKKIHLFFLNWEKLRNSARVQYPKIPKCCFKLEKKWKCSLTPTLKTSGFESMDGMWRGKLEPNLSFTVENTMNNLHKIAYSQFKHNE